MPADVFTVPDGSQPGVQAEYFDNAALAGTPRLSRTEPRPSSPNVRDPAVAAAGIPAQGWSARWTGTLRPTVSGEYALASEGGASVHLFLDDEELASTAPAARAGQPRPPAPPIVRTLHAGRAYRFRVEYRPAAARGGGGSSSGAMQVLWAPPASDLITEAVALARRSEVVIACVGLSPRLEGEEMNVEVPGFSGGDRTDIMLPTPQAHLLDALFSTGTPVVVVLTSGSAVAVPKAQQHAAAILEAWYGGEEIGTAIADVIAGRTNPSGRLPITFYRDVKQLPPFASYAMHGRTYRYFGGDVLYRFGFGLSYATFAYANLRLDRLADGGVRAAARVTNTSNRDGDEVVQLYVDGGGQADDPIRELKGFERLHLAAGESRDVTFLVDASVLASSSRARLSIGGGQPVGGVPHVRGEIRSAEPPPPPPLLSPQRGEERGEILRHRRNIRHLPAGSRVGESELPRMQGLAVNARQVRRLRRDAETVLAFAEERVAAHRGLHPDLIALAGHQLHLDERRTGEWLGHPVPRLRVAPARVLSVRLALPERRRIPGEPVAPAPARRRGPSEHDGEVDALRGAPPELGLERVTRRRCPREQDEAARVAVDAMHHVRTRARRVAIAIDQQVDERRFLAATARERLNQEAGRLVDNDDGLVVVEHAQQVPHVAQRAVGRLR